MLNIKKKNIKKYNLKGNLSDLIKWGLLTGILETFFLTIHLYGAAIQNPIYNTFFYIFRKLRIDGNIFFKKMNDQFSQIFFSFCLFIIVVIYFLRLFIKTKNNLFKGNILERIISFFIFFIFMINIYFLVKSKIDLIKLIYKVVINEVDKKIYKLTILTLDIFITIFSICYFIYYIKIRKNLEKILKKNYIRKIINNFDFKKSEIFFKNSIKKNIFNSFNNEKLINRIKLNKNDKKNNRLFYFLKLDNKMVNNEIYNFFEEYSKILKSKTKGNLFNFLKKLFEIKNSNIGNFPIFKIFLEKKVNLYKYKNELELIQNIVKNKYIDEKIWSITFFQIFNKNNNLFLMKILFEKKNYFRKNVFSKFRQKRNFRK